MSGRWEDQTSGGVTRRPLHGGTKPSQDAVVVEAPLEIRVGGETLAVTMRTPGHDRELAVGFLFAEGVLRGRDDIESAGHACAEEGSPCNVVDVTLANGALPPGEGGRAKRGTLSTAACGVCGRQSIRDLLEICEPQRVDATVAREVLAAATASLTSAQADFAHTGGSHAAAVLGVDGSVLSAHEDVGRHNAVDKSIGGLVLGGRICRPAEAAGAASPIILAVSGRVSFEIIQKAAVAGVPAVVGVSAASSLAIDLAGEMGVTLAAFARDGRFNLYTHPERVIG